MVKIKICGITNLEDAKVAIESGANALGFIFYKNSPRYVAPQKAKEIIRELNNKDVLKIGVFVNQRKEDIYRIAKLCSLEMLQFHGEETPEFCKDFKVYKTIKAFRIKNKISLEEILMYETDFYLFDNFVDDKPGGTGKTFNWRCLEEIRKKIRKPFFLSGGININNLRKAISLIRPDWIDVCSSLEDYPGKKSYWKLKSFFAEFKKLS